MLEDLQCKHKVIIAAYTAVMRLSGIDLDNANVPMPTTHVKIQRCGPPSGPSSRNCGDVEATMARWQRRQTGCGSPRSGTEQWACSMADKHYPPGFMISKFHCPHCRVFAAQEWRIRRTAHELDEFGDLNGARAVPKLNVSACASLQ